MKLYCAELDRQLMDEMVESFQAAGSDWNDTECRSQGKTMELYVTQHGRLRPRATRT
jgi:hypothetical protein